jgi:hypothetical protein
VAIHPRLVAYKGLRHLKVFSHALKHVERDLAKAGCQGFEVEVVSVRPERSLLGRMFGLIDIKNVYRQMEVTGEAHGAPFTVLLPMLDAGWMIPAIILVDLPAFSTGVAECRSATLGRKWVTEPRDQNLERALARVVPKARLRHGWGPIGVVIKVCHTLEPTDKNTTLWCVQSAYRARVFGQPVPDLAGYLNAIPALVDVLTRP